MHVCMYVRYSYVRPIARSNEEITVTSVMTKRMLCEEQFVAYIASCSRPPVEMRLN